jgi:hypothetical protein
LLSNTELTWEDQVGLVMKEIENKTKEASDNTINQQVQGYLQQVRVMNKDIVQLIQKKEQIQSMMLEKVDDAQLKNL